MDLASPDRGAASPVDGTSAREKRVAQLFKAAIGLDASARAAYLEAECAGDPGLRARIDRLLELDSGLSEPSGPSPSEWAEFRLPPGSLVGRYRLVREIAVGGMGAVYEAMQEHPRRVVALKFLRGALASTSALRRFEYEAQVLARLRHPGIAQIYEAGQHALGPGGPLPYFAMEYVEAAKPITRYAEEAHLDVRGRLELFLQVCDAVHHGHLKGVVHRDLKPSNILVDGTGVVKVIDFGVARCTDSDIAVTSLRTAVGQLVGTLQYMSPEQCDGNPNDLDTRTDVYSLGVVLYELLCSRLPYDLGGLPMHRATQRIRDDPPTRPSTIDRVLRGDLETVVLKALEKDRERRYGSALAFAADLEAFLAHRPVSARPPSVAYQLQSFARRKRALVIGTCALFVSLVAGLIGTSWQTVRARRAESEARAEARRSRTLLKSLMNIAAGTERHGRDITVLEVIEDAARFTEAGLGGSPHDRVDHFFAIGNSLFDLGRPERGEHFLRRAYELRAELLGPRHPQTIESQSWLALNLLLLGRTLEATKLAESAVAALEEMGLPPDDEILLFARAVLSAVFDDSGEHERNVTLCRDLLAHAPRDFSRRAQVENHLMRALTAQGRCDEALVFAEERLRAADFTAAGVEPVDWPVAIIQARCARSRDDWSGAFAILEQTLALIRGSYGDEHHGARQVLREMGWQRTLEGRFADAEALYRAAMGESQHHSGGDFAASSDMQQLAWALLRQAREPGISAAAAQEKLAEAEDLHRRVLEILVREPRADAEYLLKAQNQLAWFLIECGRPSEAEPIARAAVEGYRELEASPDGNKVATIDTLAVLLRDRGETAQAEQLFLEALELAVATPPFGPTLVPEVRLHLGELLIAEGRKEEARTVLLASERALESVAPAGEELHRQVLARMEELSR